MRYHSGQKSIKSETYYLRNFSYNLFMGIEIKKILQNDIFRQIFAHCDVRVDRINESGRKKVFRRKKGFSA